MHRYTVGLRIVGDDLDPDKVTSTLGVEPTHVRRKGEKKTQTSSWAHGMWGFEITPPEGDQWVSLEDSLNAFFAVFGSLKDRIQSCSAGHEVYVWCGHFTSSFDGGPILSPSIMKKMGEFGVQLMLDTYCHVAEDRQTGKSKRISGGTR